MYANSYTYMCLYTYMCRMHLYILNTFQTWCPASRRENSQVSLQRKGFLSIAQSIAQHRALSLGPSNRGGHCMVVEYVSFSEGTVCIITQHMCERGFTTVYHSTLSYSRVQIHQHGSETNGLWLSSLNRWIHLECWQPFAIFFRGFHDFHDFHVSLSCMVESDGKTSTLSVTSNADCFIIL